MPYDAIKPDENAPPNATGPKQGKKKRCTVAAAVCGGGSSSVAAHARKSCAVGYSSWIHIGCLKKEIRYKPYFEFNVPLVTMRFGGLGRSGRWHLRWY